MDKKQKYKSFGIICFVSSIISFILILSGLFDVGPRYLFSSIFIVISLILGLITIYKNGEGKKMALAGVIICLVILFVSFLALGSAQSVSELQNSFFNNIS